MELDLFAFPQKLRYYRDKKGISQDELSKVMQFTRGCIGNYEQGTRKPDLITVQRLANFFGISTDELLGHPTKEDLGQASDEDIYKNLDIALDRSKTVDGEQIPQEEKDKLKELFFAAIKLIKQKTARLILTV